MATQQTRSFSKNFRTDAFNRIRLRPGSSLLAALPWVGLLDSVDHASNQRLEELRDEA